LRKVLIVAFHFPPLHGSSGFLRTLSFAQHLPEFGWEPIVLTAWPPAYESLNEDNLQLIPKTLRVLRAPALDARKHLSLRGRYPGFLAVPDRWQSWLVPAVFTGLLEIKRSDIAAVMTTFPIATAHLIGLALKKTAGLPWIADFRDPMAQTDYPEDPAIHRAYSWIEGRTFRNAELVTVTAPSAASFYADRYGDGLKTRIHVVENGADPNLIPPPKPLLKQTRLIKGIHSGLLYPDARDPSNLFEAIASLAAEGLIDEGGFELSLRATGYDAEHTQTTARYGVERFVRFLPPIGYEQSLAEINEHDFVLLIQSNVANFQIPAKAYEYLFSRKPMLALTDPNGDTGALLRRAGVRQVVALEDRGAVKSALASLIHELREAPVVAMPYDVEGMSRRERAKSMALLLDGLATSPR
jgi:hypothetical protein